MSFYAPTGRHYGRKHETARRSFFCCCGLADLRSCAAQRGWVPGEYLWVSLWKLFEWCFGDGGSLESSFFNYKILKHKFFKYGFLTYNELKSTNISLNSSFLPNQLTRDYLSFLALLWFQKCMPEDYRTSRLLKPSFFFIYEFLEKNIS